MTSLDGPYYEFDKILRKLVYQVIGGKQFSLSGMQEIYFPRVLKAMIRKNVLYRDFVYEIDGITKKARFMLVKIPADAKKINTQAKFTMHFIQEVDVPITEEERAVYLEAQTKTILPNGSMLGPKPK